MKVRRVDFYPDDWIVGTHMLDPAERGVYITICALIYSRGEAITEELLKAYCKTTHGLMINRCLKRLRMLGKISENGGRITVERCEKELKRSRERHEKAERNAAKRWQNKDITNADASHSSNASRRYLQQTTYNNQQKREHRSASPHESGGRRSRSPAKVPMHIRLNHFEGCECRACSADRAEQAASVAASDAAPDSDAAAE